MPSLIDPLRRRYMIAVVRLAQSAEPAALDGIALFDLFAAIGEPPFPVWRGHVETFAERQAEGAAEEVDSTGPPTHREFDARLRRERAIAGSSKQESKKPAHCQEATHGS